MKRFFSHAEARKTENNCWQIFLDDRPLKNQASKTCFELASAVLAQAIASEWQAVPEEFDFKTLPLSRLVMGAVELSYEQRENIISKMTAYAQSDTLCFMAPHPKELFKLQQEKWVPLIEWINEKGCEFKPDQGLSMPLVSEKTRLFLKSYLAMQNNIELSCLQIISGACQSVILSIAVAQEHLTAGEAFDLSCLEELFQNKLWTADEEALKSRISRREEAVRAGEVLKLLRKKGE